MIAFGAGPSSAPTRPIGSDERPWPRVAAGAFWLLLAVFAVIRLGPIFSDLWLDEIWSITLVRQLASPAEIFTRFLVDNNHPLNSLWIYLVGITSADWVYRVLSWLAGVASVALAGEIARIQWRRLQPAATETEGDAARLITAILFGGSYLFIFYSSEARGYSPAVACALFAWYSLLHGEAEPRGFRAPLYWLACIAGLAAHVVVMQVIVGGIAYSTVRARGTAQPLATLARWHAVPLAASVIYYVGFVRRLIVGGGPQLSPARVLSEMSAYTFGVPIDAGMLLALPLFIAVVVAGLWLLRANRALVAFYVGVFAVAAVAPFAGQFDVVYPRYFTLVAACALLLAGQLLTHAFAASRGWRIMAVGALVFFLTGNARTWVVLWQHGRGEYSAAIRYVTAHTATETVFVTSDQDARNRTVLAYFWPRVAPGKTLAYLAENERAAQPPQWLFVHRFDGEAPPPRELTGAGGDTFQLAAQFRHAPLSGWDWFVFRNPRTAPAGAPR